MHTARVALLEWFRNLDGVISGEEKYNSQVQQVGHRHSHWDCRPVGCSIVPTT